MEFQQKAFGAFHKDPTQVKQSSSGGVFPQLARHILSQGGAVFGAAYDPSFHVVPCCVTEEAELPALYGSKYVFCPMNAVWEDARQRLSAGTPVLFTASPCQAAAFRHFLNQDFPHLYCVDFVCHGAPEPKSLEQYLAELSQEYGAAVSSVNFRKKQTSWQDYVVEVTFANGQTYTSVPSDDPYMKTFLQNLNLRRACASCVYKGKNRLSDLTLGDFWGVSKLYAEIFHKEGTSLVFANTRKGLDLLMKARDGLHIVEVSPEKAVKYNASAVSAAKLHKNYDAFQADPGTFRQKLSHCSENRALGVKQALKKLFRR